MRACPKTRFRNIAGTSRFRNIQAIRHFGDPTALAQSADEAAAVVDRMASRSSLKIESAQITHKSDIGGVALKLSDDS